MNDARGGHRELLTGGLFVLAVFLFLYWRYPFDGMILSDSWFFYANDGGQFRWYNNAGIAGQHGTDVYELSVYRPDWSTLFGNRGLIPIVAWGLSLIPIEHRQLGANVLAIAVQVLNAGLFGLIVARLAGARIAQASLICAVLYPFAAASHFWQFLIINNLAATCFLVAVLAFVTIDHEAPGPSPRTWALGLLTLVCYWASLILVAYAVFMGPVFVYLALTLANGGHAVLKFRRLRTPGLLIACLAVVMSIAAVGLFSGGAPSFLSYALRYQELGAKVGIPWQLVGAAAALGSGTLTFLSAAFSNTAGLVVYPLALVIRNEAVLRESARVIPTIMVLAVVATVLLSSPASPRPAARPTTEVGVLYMVCALWTALAYLPFMTAFGYPRIVGLMADRVNILACWGVCLGLGLFISQIAARQPGRRARIALPAVLFCIVGLWLANLYVQKSYYVEAYQKERRIALTVLGERGVRGSDGRAPVVLLRRATKVKYPRERLLAALQGGSTSQRAASVLEFVFRRYLVDDYTTSSFDLGGLMLFGCCPATAFMTVDGYAHLQKVPSVPVYKDEPPLRLDQTETEFRLGYEDSGVIARGSARVDRYSKATHRLVWVDLDESFFTLQGGSNALLIR